MKYVENTARWKMREAQGWQLLHEALQKAHLTEEQWDCVNLALRFPVLEELATDVELSG
jgi:hypothetical protein